MVFIRFKLKFEAKSLVLCYKSNRQRVLFNLSTISDLQKRFFLQTEYITIVILFTDKFLELLVDNWKEHGNRFVFKILGIRVLNLAGPEDIEVSSLLSMFMITQRSWSNQTRSQTSSDPTYISMSSRSFIKKIRLFLNSHQCRTISTYIHFSSHT